MLSFSRKLLLSPFRRYSHFKYLTFFQYVMVRSDKSHILNNVCTNVDLHDNRTKVKFLALGHTNVGVLASGWTKIDPNVGRKKHRVGRSKVAASWTTFLSDYLMSRSLWWANSVFFAKLISRFTLAVVNLAKTELWTRLDPSSESDLPKSWWKWKRCIKINFL